MTDTCACLATKLEDHHRFIASIEGLASGWTTHDTMSSSDEGEIRENGVEVSKATSLPQTKRNGVDRQDRSQISNTRSPDQGDYRSRQPRSPRGYKRSRDDDRDTYHRGGRGSSDPRHFRVHYEDGPPPQSRHAYEDLDRPASRGRYEGIDRPSDHRQYESRDRHSGSSRYDKRDRDYGRADKRPRTRSPSPYRHSRGDGRERHQRGRWDADGPGRNRPGEQIENTRNGAQTAKQVRDDTASKRSPEAGAKSVSKEVAKSDQGATDERMAEGTSHLHITYFAPFLKAAGQLLTSNSDSSDAAAKDSKIEPDQDWDEPTPLDEEAEIERRRRRREALLRKSRASTPLLVQAVQANKHDHTVETPSEAATPQKTPRTPASGKPEPKIKLLQPANKVGAASPAGRTQGSMSPEALAVANDRELINTHGDVKTTDEDGPSAADYDPTIDMWEDERRDEMRNGNIGLHGEGRRESVDASGKDEPMHTTETENEDDDDFDMFAEDFDEEKLAAPKSAPTAKAPTEDPIALQGGKGGAILEDDDKDGYYKIRPSEILNGRYQVQSSLGKGMFSGVARAVDITTKKLIAIKIMRNNDALKKGGFTEIAILQKLNSADPENKKHIVKFERSFEHKGHLCMAFENLSLNLREVLKKFGNNVGINLHATKAYAYQIFLALAHMRKCSIIHADLKPDNILVSLLSITILKYEHRTLTR